MKQRILEYIAFTIAALAIGFILGTAGLSDCNVISIGQCALRIFIGLIILGADALFICWLGRRSSFESNM